MTDGPRRGKTPGRLGRLSSQLHGVEAVDESWRMTAPRPAFQPFMKAVSQKHNSVSLAQTSAVDVCHNP